MAPYASHQGIIANHSWFREKTTPYSRRTSGGFAPIPPLFRAISTVCLRQFFPIFAAYLSCCGAKTLRNRVE
jgi:hypothetical protein